MGKTAISYLRAPELVEEFLRMEALYPALPSPLPCPRQTLAFPVETSWRGSSQSWPAEFRNVITAVAAAAREDAGETLQPAVEAVGADGVAAAARMAQLCGDEQGRPQRRRMVARSSHD